MPLYKHHRLGYTPPRFERPGGVPGAWVAAIATRCGVNVDKLYYER